MGKYDHIEDEWVKEALEEYKDKIDSKKIHRLDLSSYTVEKGWGREIWLELNEHYRFQTNSYECWATMQSAMA